MHDFCWSFCIKKPGCNGTKCKGRKFWVGHLHWAHIISYFPLGLALEKCNRYVCEPSLCLGSLQHILKLCWPESLIIESFLHDPFPQNVPILLPLLHVALNYNLIMSCIAALLCLQS